jgi:hypothetical protein
MVTSNVKDKYSPWPGKKVIKLSVYNCRPTAKQAILMDPVLHFMQPYRAGCLKLILICMGEKSSYNLSRGTDNSDRYSSVILGFSKKISQLSYGHDLPQPFQMKCLLLSYQIYSLN